MRKWIETTGRSEEDAIAAALFQLNLERDDVSVEVLERAKPGFLGFGSNPAKVRVSYEAAVEETPAKPAPSPVAETPPVQAAPAAPAKAPVQPAPAVSGQTPAQPGQEETILAASPRKKPSAKPATDGQLQPGDEVLIEKSYLRTQTLSPVSADDPRAERIAQFLTGLMERLNVTAVPEIMVNEEGHYKVILQGSGLGAIIGRRGETLDAIQQLTNYAVNNAQAKRVRVHVDAEGYRAKREESLQRLAEKMAEKALKYRKNMVLEAMNAYERHVIHTALQDYPGITTHSTGVEPNRRIVVACSTDKK